MRALYDQSVCILILLKNKAGTENFFVIMEGRGAVSEGGGDRNNLAPPHRKGMG